MRKTAIRVRNLTRDFAADAGPIRAVDRLSLEVPSGIAFGFLGPNGAGKTTTNRLLLGLLEPTDGRAEVPRFDTRTQADEVRTRTGALLQHSGIYEQVSAWDKLEFYARVRRLPKVERQARIKELLCRMSLSERRREPSGKWGQVMKQKLALARTQFHRPSLLLDEPMAGVDVVAVVEVRECPSILVLEGTGDRSIVTLDLSPRLGILAWVYSADRMSLT